MISNYIALMNRDLILFQIGRIQYKASRFLLGELRQHGITGIAPSHGEILGFLLVRGPMSMKEIAALIDKDKSTITALVDKLIGMEFVIKRKSPGDSRVNIISLTEKGEALKGKYKDISSRLRAKAYRDISEEERETLSRLLERLNRNL